jgi:hypothetical protein
VTRRLLLVLVLLGALPAWAGASTILGKPRPERVQGTARADLIDVVGGGRDRVRCGPGLDTVVADKTDAVAADCEIVSRRIALDTSSGAGAHRTIVEPALAANGSTLVSVFQVGRQRQGADTIGFAASNDRGRTWRSGRMPSLTQDSAPAGPWIAASDPVVAYDAMHTRWIAVSLALDANDEALATEISPDGVAWQPHTAVARRSRTGSIGVPYDKEWIACDNGIASPTRGRCYVAATEDADTPGATLTLWWTADGAASWTRGATIPAGYYSQLAVRPDGGLVALYLDQAQHHFAAAVSRDGGITFDPPAVVPLPLIGAGQKDLRTPGLPSLAVGAGGELVVVVPGCVAAPCALASVLLSRSGDGGATWSPPVTLTLGAGSHQVPAIAADPASGSLAIADYVAGSSLEPCCAILAEVATSPDDGATWRVRRTSVRPFRSAWLAPALGGAFLGDYVGAAFSGGHAVAVMPFAEPPSAGVLQEDLYATRL